MINNKVDFVVTIEVESANPNGDPLAGNMPRTDSKGYGLISDVSIKRKIRNRMQDLGKEIFVKSRDRTDDGFNSLEKRYSEYFDKKDDDETVYKGACERWLDVRSFGQVITFQNKSIGIRGPVSIGISKSLEPVEITSMQITRSTNGMEPKGKSNRSSDTIGTKHYVEYGTYVIYGSVNSNFSEKTGFNEEDLGVLKETLQSLFVNDASSARPEGSMGVKEIFWFKHSNKDGNVSSAKLRELVEYATPEGTDRQYSDYNFHLNEEKLKEIKDFGVEVSIMEGL